MKANELRIGNWVQYPNYNKDGTVKYFKIRDIYTDDDKISLTDGRIQLPSSNLKYIKPVPLTEEWLLKFRFVKSSNKLMFLPMPKIKAELHYEKHNYGNVITIQSDFGMLIPDDIKYVHQLQNLYLALTGEELNIKID